MTDFSLINLGDRWKPVDTLITKIADTIWWITAPKQIERIAAAEVAANKIRAMGRIEVSEIEERGLRRLVTQEWKRQENIENIAFQAFPLVKDDATPEKMDQDRITHFFENCKDVSDADMQAIWAGILAGEANLPGTFSKRTITFMRSLEKSEAELFTKLCGFIWQIDWRYSPLIYNYKEAIYKDNGLYFSAIKHLESIWLIAFEVTLQYTQTKLPQKAEARYWDTTYVFSFSQENNNELFTGWVSLTAMGLELAKIVRSDTINGLEDYVVEKIQQQNVGVEFIAKGK